MGADCSNTELSEEDDDDKCENTDGDDPSLFTDYTKGTVWSQKRNHKTCIIRNTPFAVDHYIYYSTDYQKGESGIVIYNTKSNKYDKTIKYGYKPFTPCFHSYTYFNDKIYIIAGESNSIIVYDLKTNKCESQLIIDTLLRVGRFSTSIMIHGNIHIIGGHKNNSLHRMYDINKNTMYGASNRNNENVIHNPCVVYINKLNKLFMFGGYDIYKGEALNTFYCSSVVIDDNFIQSVKNVILNKGFPSDVMNIILEYMVDDNDELNIVWEQNKITTLPISLSRCGYILYENWILTFGGYTNHKYIAEIYCLDICDMNNNNNWKVLQEIVCPLKACYHAVLVNNKTIHLFTRSNNIKHPQHFVVPIKEILSASKISAK